MVRRGVPDIAPNNATVSGMLSTTGRCSPRLALTPGDTPSTFTPSTSGPRRRDELSRTARCSRGKEGDVQQLARRLGVIEPFGEHSERERLDAGNGLVSGCAVAEYPGQLWDLGNPATVVFELEFDPETETHGRTVARPASRCPTRVCSRRRPARK